MKRTWVLFLMLSLLLTGCSRKPQTPPVSEPEERPLGEIVQEAYGTIALGKDFRVSVEEPDGAVTELDITEENAWNVEGLAHLLAESYTWSAAAEADWENLLQDKDRGYLLTVSSRDGKTVLSCCSGSDLARLEQDGGAVYCKAVNPKEGTEPFEGKLYDQLEMIARDAVAAQVWRVTADGALEPADAAERLMEQVAEHYRAVPDWVDWKPVELLEDGTQVYDIYWGDPQQFCCGMGFRVKLEDPMSSEAVYWQAGAGLEAPDSEGFAGWGKEVYVVKDGTGDWMVADYGTGGYYVELPVREETATAEQLVEAFRLTEGESHDRMIPIRLLSLSETELAKLPEAMDTLPEEMAKELCRRLEEQLDATKESGGWVLEDLREVLGPYGRYLDV